MNREIKFRGKRINTGQWVWGFYVHDVEWAKHWIFYPKHTGAFIELVKAEVEEKSVGQFTGRKDKNGKEIYEGDVCDGKYPAVESDTYRNVVKWDSDGYGFEFANAPLWAWDIEVIGNKFEYPELLA